MNKADNKITITSIGSSSISKAEADKIICEIYNKYNAFLFRYLRQRLNSIEDANDVIQEVYLRLIRHPKLKELNPSYSLLKKITADLLSDRFRRQNVRAIKYHVSLNDLEIESSIGSPEQLLKSKEGMDVIKKIFRSLNKSSRRAFVLNRFKGLTYQEIAKKMGISRSMVQKHISSVLLQVNIELEKYL